MPQQMGRDPLSLPHITRPGLLEPCLLSSSVQEPLDLPGRDMALVPALKDISLCPPLQMGLQGIQDGPGED